MFLVPRFGNAFCHLLLFFPVLYLKFLLPGASVERMPRSERERRTSGEGWAALTAPGIILSYWISWIILNHAKKFFATQLCLLFCFAKIQSQDAMLDWSLWKFHDFSWRWRVGGSRKFLQKTWRIAMVQRKLPTSIHLTSSFQMYISYNMIVW